MLVMGYGFCNAPADVTRLMAHDLDYIHQFVIAYFDHIYIYSKSPEDHLDHIRQAFKTLRNNTLSIKMVKCFWAKREAEDLGFIIGNGNVRRSPSKVIALKYWTLPETRKHIKSFVAFCSFNRKFIHHFAECSAPLTDLCRTYLPGRGLHRDATKSVFKTLRPLFPRSELK